MVKRFVEGVHHPDTCRIRGMPGTEKKRRKHFTWHRRWTIFLRNECSRLDWLPDGT
jgi:hypothetical protein